MTRRTIGTIAVASDLRHPRRGAGHGHEDQLEGIAPGNTRLVYAVQAAFERESYRPSQRARLVIRHHSRAVTVQIFESGPERIPTLSGDVMNGVPVTRERAIGRASGRRVLTVRIGRWDSGLYSHVSELRMAASALRHSSSRHAASGYGASRSSCPHSRGRPTTSETTTATASRTRGTPNEHVNSVRLGRAFLDRGVPYGFRNHLGFLNWLHWTHRKSDYLSQWDLEQVEPDSRSGRCVRPHRLRRAPRVCDDSRVRPHRGVPRPRRQSDVPLSEQLLLRVERQGRRADEIRPLAGSRPSRGYAP